MTEIEKGYFLNLKGMIYQGMCDINKDIENMSTVSLNSYIESLKIFERLYKETPDLAIRQKIADLQNNIGNVYIYFKNDPEEGNKYVRKAIQSEMDLYGKVISQNFFWNLRDAYLKNNEKNNLVKLFAEATQKTETGTEAYNTFLTCYRLHEKQNDDSLELSKLEQAQIADPKWRKHCGL